MTSSVPNGSRRKKKRNLNSILREAWLTRKYRASAFAQGFSYDWSASRYNRIAIVNLLLSRSIGGDYLEIGCAGNQLFDAVMAVRKVGVDPAQGGTHRMTSDAYFAQCPEARFDVIFIDGLHTYDQVRRDLVHALTAVKPGGWIAMHDMLPRDWIDEHVPQISTAGWTGDGWKAAFELAATPGLEFRLVAIDHGVVVIKVAAPAPRLTDFSTVLGPRRFNYLYDHAGELPIVDWPEFRQWIDRLTPP